jgi:hypothetical protein
MDQTTIRRRRFLGLLAFATCIPTILKWRWMAGPFDLDWFYVAGVRFNPVEMPPGLNERVRIQRREWRGHPYYEIQTESGERLGYVPRRYIARIAKIENREWRVCSVKPHAVPWKRYKILRAS